LTVAPDGVIVPAVNSTPTFGVPLIAPIVVMEIVEEPLPPPPPLVVVATITVFSPFTGFVPANTPVEPDPAVTFAPIVVTTTLSEFACTVPTLPEPLTFAPLAFGFVTILVT